MKSAADISAISGINEVRATHVDRDPPLMVIEPRGRWRTLRLGELWRSRELIGFFAWRDLKVRYKQTALGAGWAMLQPLATMAVFSVFFGRLARMPSDGIPYPLFALAALVPWTFFSMALQSASGSLVSHQGLLRKVYFPRSAVPLSSVLAAGVDLLVALGLLLVMAAWYGYLPGSKTLWVAPLALMAASAALGAGLLLSALNVAYRDVRYVLPFLMQFWLFATPVAYPSSLLDPAWRTLYAVNPMVGVVEGFRWALFGTGAAPVMLVAVSAASAGLLLVGGTLYFGHREQTFADVV